MTLEYHVPQLGKISTKLYPYSIQTYELLNHYGHIDRLRSIDQLGVIRNVYEGAHHSRWEYVMLQLSLIYKLSVETDEKSNKLASGLGLNSNNIEFPGRYPSGADILQMWTLLFNAGHLPGTFATERALLRSCKQHKDIRQTIYTGLPQTKRKYFKEILEKEDIYSFHKVLISFQLERYRRHKFNTAHFIDFLQSIIDFYLFDSKDHKQSQKNYKMLFQKIRQISYLFLDFQYGPIPVDFDLGAIFFNLQDYIPVLFKEPDSPIIRALDSFENLLSINMYHSADSIRELGGHVKQVERILGENKELWQLNKITGLKRYLKNGLKTFQSFHKDWRNSFSIHILFELPLPLFISIFKKHLTFNIEESWNKKYGARTCQLTFQAAPKSLQIAINLSFYRESKTHTNVCIIRNFLKDIINLNDKIKSEIKSEPAPKYYSLTIDWIFQKPYQELVISILRYITHGNLHFEFKHDNITGSQMLSIKGSTTAANKIKEIYKNLESSNPRFSELETLQQTLVNLNYRSELLLPLSRILVYDNERKPLTDIDGFGLGVKNGTLGVLLVEAKHQKKGSISSSKNHLEATLEKLKFKTSKTPHIFETKGGAYCYLKIDGK